MLISPICRHWGRPHIVFISYMHVAATVGLSLTVLRALQTCSVDFLNVDIKQSSKPQIFFIANWFNLWPIGVDFLLMSILDHRVFNRFSSLGQGINPCYSGIM